MMSHSDSLIWWAPAVAFCLERQKSVLQLEDRANTVSVCMQEWASLIFIVVALYMVVSALFALMFWGIVVRRLILKATKHVHMQQPTRI